MGKDNLEPKHGQMYFFCLTVVIKKLKKVVF